MVLLNHNFMKRLNKLVLLATVVFLSVEEVFAQGVRGEMSRLLNDYAAPIISGMLIIGAAFGFVQNYDKIIDKDGNGTRKEGIINMVWIIGYVLIAMVLLGIIVSTVGSMRLG